MTPAVGGTAMIALSDARLAALLEQDVPYGDLTTGLLGIASMPGVVRFCARGDMVLAGVEEAARLLELAGASICPGMASSGVFLPAGTEFLRAEGQAGALHRGWKPAQTLVEACSGIAGRARRIVEAARSVAPSCVVACTRKNFPGGKELSVKAVLSGGAQMHRLGLSETVLVFPEHRAFLPADPLLWLPPLKARAPERKIMVETAEVAEACALIDAGADVVQLEKMPPDQAARVVAHARSRARPPTISAAGGVDEGNAAAYAAAGCTVLVTSAPFLAKPADVKVYLGRR
jgi:molybdenum transport protein